MTNLKSTISEAKFRKTSEERLLELAFHEDEDVRSAVAKNRSITDKVCRVVVKDPEWGVRYLLALNPKTPPDVLEILALDPAPGVRQHVAAHKKVPIHILEVLATDSKVYIQESVAKNSLCPEHLKMKLMHDSEPRVQSATNISTSPSEKLAPNTETGKTGIYPPFEVDLPEHLDPKTINKIQLSLKVLFDKVRRCDDDHDAIETAIEQVIDRLTEIDDQTPFIGTIERESLTECLTNIVLSHAKVEENRIVEWIDSYRDW